MLRPLEDNSGGRSIDRLTENVLDALVVGGGIVGAGVARDAAMRGLRVGLIDRRDFAFGTSSRSSRLLHGGLRYLAQGRIGLVREASREKMILHSIAPHLAEPLPFIFPTRRGTPWKRWKLRLGVKVYDLLCGGRNLGYSSCLSEVKTLNLLPGLNGQDLTGSVRYFDGLTSDARLVLDTIRSAHGSGANVMNYLELQDAERQGEVWHCRVRDDLTGRCALVQAKTVVNATGAWANRFAASQVSLRLTKGVHLVVDRRRLPVPDAVVMSEGRRILFAIPWGERVILGTTDTDYTGPVDSPACDLSDMQYILDIVNATFPGAKLHREDVISTWAGIRPLISRKDETGQPSDISRRHEIGMTEPGWIDVAGGKLTTYRLMAEQTVDLIVQHTGASARASTTARLPLLADAHEARFSSIVPPAVSREAVENFCTKEWATHLDDVMIRRTSWRYYHRSHLEIARRVSHWMAEQLGWDAATTRAELTRYWRACMDDSACVASDANELSNLLTEPQSLQVAEHEKVAAHKR
jgi:glycerol-3-phosphate dehydrogenase